DLEAVDRDYDSTYWPGGSDWSSAFPLPVGSGVRIDLGQLNVRKVPKYRVRVSVSGDPCVAGDSIALDIVAASDPGSETHLGRAPCGKDVLMRGFAAGSYRLEMAVSGKGHGTSAAIPFDVVDKNIAVSVPVTRGVDLDGKVIVTEGVRSPDFGSIQLLIRPLGWAIRNAPTPIDPEGKFRITNVEIRDFQLLISGIPRTHCVKEVRYNGHRLVGDVFSMDPSAQAHSLVMILDDKPATVMGSVMDRDKPVRQPHVVLVRWPPSGLDLFSSVLTTAGSEKGQFQFPGLAPGEYRILAVSAEAKGRLERPSVLERLLASAEKLSLNERAVQNLTLKLTEP
ncbi:MAG: carboxypeptidase-like regulatory domain-containing protein, partial [Acidobacteria bacterium]|nr:carboxypeptidase-like regulatory domain-containing protein [Acidobacteriota bacterium]